MIRKIIHIDEEKCNGCGLCAEACHEGAIDIVDGKAKLMRENFCDGFGDCLPGCPTGAITFEERDHPPNGGSLLRRSPESCGKRCQIKLVPTQAPFFDGAKLLIAADCTAYAYANMHEDFMRGKVTIIGCPKLDAVDYTDKLTEIIRNNDIKSVTILRMEVPCCGGLQRAAENALRSSGKFIPWQVVTISRDGRILD